MRRNVTTYFLNAFTGLSAKNENFNAVGKFAKGHSSSFDWSIAGRRQNSAGGLEARRGP